MSYDQIQGQSHKGLKCAKMADGYLHLWKTNFASYEESTSSPVWSFIYYYCYCSCCSSMALVIITVRY